MAHFEKDRCQGCHRNKESKSYCVVMRLCDDCARNKGHFIRELSREKKAVFHCHIHTDLKALAFCEKHEVTVCLECLSSHIGRPCSLIDLDVGVTERRNQLCNLLERCKGRVAEFEEFNVNVDVRSNQIMNHLAGIKDEILNVTSQKRREVEEMRDRVAEQIRRNAEEEITRIQQQRDESLMENQREADKGLHKIREKEREILERLGEVRSMFDQKLTEMKSYLQTFLENVQKAKSLDDEGMLKPEFKMLVSSLTKALDRQVSTCGVDKLVEAAESVSLSKEYDDEGLEIHVLERLDMPVEVWDERNSITRTTGLGTGPYMMGAISENEVILKNRDNGSVHTLNIHSGNTRMVIAGRTPYDVYSCAPLRDGKVVCGTRFGEIVVYDHVWNHLRTIYFDKSGKSVQIRPVSLCIDTNNLLFATNGGRTVHVFNPDNGDFIRSIDVNVRSICELHLLPSDDIALRIRSVDEDCSDVRILDKSGCLRSIRHLHNKNLMSMAVDAAHDRISLMLHDHENDSDDFDIVVLSRNGLADLDIELPFDSRTLAEMCFMPKKEVLVVHYDRKIAIFEKTKPGLEEIIENID